MPSPSPDKRHNSVITKINDEQDKKSEEKSFDVLLCNRSLA